MDIIRTMLFGLIGFLFFAGANIQGDIIADVRDAIKTGSSREIAKFLNTKVDMTIDKTLNSYSKAQSELVLKDFFKRNPPSGFTIIHQGTSKTGHGPYFLGDYISQGNTFRIFVLMRKVGDQFLVYQIDFTKE